MPREKPPTTAPLPALTPDVYPTITSTSTISPTRIWWKVDLCVLPVVTMLFFLSFLDRVNLGNARVAGLEKDLHLSDWQFSVALTITYIPYMAAELPSNLLLKRLGANVMLPTMVVLWGLITVIQGLVKDYKGLLICRFFLGLMEGGLFPGLVLYLSMFYPRQRLQTRQVLLNRIRSTSNTLLVQFRISIFFSAVSLAGAFSGLLAFGLIRLSGKGNRPGWAWIFIIEGLFTFLFGFLSYFLLPRGPETARFLQPEEREWIVSLLREDGALGRDEADDSFRWGEVRMAFKLPHVWIMAIVLFCNGTLMYSVAYFAPSIVHALGYNAARAQLMTVPPFAAAFGLATIGSFVSDYFGCRGLASAFGATLAIAGFTIFLTSPTHQLRYASLFFSIPGIYLTAPSLTTWSANNVSPYTRRATATAFGFITGNAGGILATWLMLAAENVRLDRDDHQVGGKGKRVHGLPKEYRKGTIILIALAGVVVVGSLLNVIYLSRKNEEKRKRRRDIVLAGGGRENEEALFGDASGRLVLGDKSAWFVYAL